MKDCSECNANIQRWLRSYEVWYRTQGLFDRADILRQMAECEPNRMWTYNRILLREHNHTMGGGIGIGPC